MQNLSHQNKHEHKHTDTDRQTDIQSIYYIEIKFAFSEISADDESVKKRIGNRLKFV